MTHASYFGTLPKLDKSCCVYSGFDYRNLLLSIKRGFYLENRRENQSRSGVEFHRGSRQFREVL